MDARASIPLFRPAGFPLLPKVLGILASCSWIVNQFHTDGMPLRGSLGEMTKYECQLWSTGPSWAIVAKLFQGMWPENPDDPENPTIPRLYMAIVKGRVLTGGSFSPK